MKKSTNAQDWYLSVVSGQNKSMPAAMARGVFAAAEPVYTTAVHARNFLYTRRILKAAHARRPVVSIGNITTGGTGKTPMVAWLVAELRAAGRMPAVLLRGYQSNGGSSDEELLLRDLVKPSPVQAQADRFAASERVLAEHPEVDAFVLDDGLQHRQLARYFSIVLVDATAPFGFDRVLPRGLLREPMRGLRRASAVVITRVDLSDSATLLDIEQKIRAEQPQVPVFYCNLKQNRVIDSDGQTKPIESLINQSVFAFCGIGNPDAFVQQIQRSGAKVVGTRQFRDHHPYIGSELSAVLEEATAAGAEMVVTTEKDWVKVGPLVERLPKRPAIFRIGVSVEILNDEGPRLVEMVMGGIREGDDLLGWKK